MAEECFAAGMRFGKNLADAMEAADWLDNTRNRSRATTGALESMYKALKGSLSEVQYEMSQHEDCFGAGDIEDVILRLSEINTAADRGDYKVAKDELKDIYEILE